MSLKFSTKTPERRSRLRVSVSIRYKKFVLISFSVSDFLMKLEFLPCILFLSFSLLIFVQKDSDVNHLPSGLC